MVRLVPIRDDDVPSTLVVLREGVNTLSDESLAAACERAHGEIGLLGFSVLEVPHGDFAELARLRPLLKVRRKVRTALGAELVAAGFVLVPTLDFPHWTLVLPEATEEHFKRVRWVFSEPIDNPAYESRRR
ncbi:hypothetical protein ACIRON_29785 [Nocardioides sp. NPDC101246]|uniref:hypothetical protein n=1 Tax=Nocardioides sp. NPDC101246 TaxID=3364336 RepID=UPI00380F2F5B